MNIRLVISNYINQDGKSKVLFDCSENTYRKKIDTRVKVQNFDQIGLRLRENELDNFSFETKILLDRLFEKAKDAIRKYNDLGWKYIELENFLKEPIYKYSVEHYVSEVFNKSRTIITSKDYLNVVNVFKKYLKKNTITFDFLLDPQNVLKFKFTDKGVELKFLTGGDIHSTESQKVYLSRTLNKSQAENFMKYINEVYTNYEKHWK